MVAVTSAATSSDLIMAAPDGDVFAEQEGREGEDLRALLFWGWLVVFGGVGSGWGRMLGERGGDLVEVVLDAVDADHGGVAFAVVVVDVDGGDVLLGLHEKVDRLGAGFGSDEGLMQRFRGEDEVVDGDQFLAGSQLGLVGGAAYADVEDGAVGCQLEAEGVPDEGSGT